MLNGLLLVDKPEGVSSFGVVAQVRGVILREIKSQHTARGYCKQPAEGLSGTQGCRCRYKVGHIGTLDPAATGLLVLALGTYTKKVPELIKKDKTYEVEMTLGKTSTTGDKEGDISVVSDTQPTQEQILDALRRFSGKIMQTPPAFSAVKVNGKRAYDLARSGKTVVLEPRQITIYNNSLHSYKYPIVQFTSKVGSGTYIRSLVEDIGDQLGTGAYMSNLRRTQIGTFSIDTSVALSNVSLCVIQKNILF